MVDISADLQREEDSLFFLKKKIELSVDWLDVNFLLRDKEPKLIPYDILHEKFG